VPSNADNRIDIELSSEQLTFEVESVNNLRLRSARGATGRHTLCFTAHVPVSLSALERAARL
jgi:hypothetical protein